MTERSESERADPTKLSDVELLNYCGDSGLKWAEAFCQIKQKQGWSAADIDESLMLGWFANAIEHSTALRHNAPPDSGAGKSEQPAVLTYTNYRGETSVRSIIPRSVRYGSTEWHPEPQWLLLAHDTEKQADREFALKDFGMPDHGGADAGVKAQIATLAQRFWTIHPRELQDKGMTREEFYIREMTALVASLSKPAPVAASASAEARLREALENTNQLLIDVMHDQEADIRDRASKQFDKNIDALSKPAPVAASASAEARLREDAKPRKVVTLQDFTCDKCDGTGRYEDESCPQCLGEGSYEEPIVVECVTADALSAHPHASDCDKQGER